jgi:hypothetical protein
MINNLNAEQVLDAMHRAIMGADFAALGTLTPALEDALVFAQNSRDPALLKRLRDKANRNAACLLAAGRGVRAAQRRVAELRDANIGFATYDGRGKRAQHAVPARLTKRF